MYGIADLDNCYCSCEKVFRPDLEGKPIVVLSNNDGCVVARSNEAKAMGIKEGTPYFQLAQQFPNQKIAVFSSNYELYGELTSRVISIISKETPAYFRYSIDECFMYLDGIELDKLQQWGERLHRRVKREVGMPISIGLAPNKTLAKIASKLAKKFEAYKHCCMRLIRTTSVNGHLNGVPSRMYGALADAMQPNSSHLVAGRPSTLPSITRIGYDRRSTTSTWCARGRN